MQAFAAHIAFVQGSLDLQDIIDPVLLEADKPIGALGLAAAAVSFLCAYRILLTSLFKVKHALTLVKDSVITIASVKASFPKCPTLPKSVNASTSKASKTALAFNEDGWGSMTRGVTKLAARITQNPYKFEKIEKEAWAYAHTSTHAVVSMYACSTQDEMDGDEWTNMMDAYDTDDNSTDGRDD